MSPSSRRAWVEINCGLKLMYKPNVALLAEGVGRNDHLPAALADDLGRPPRGGRG